MDPHRPARATFLHCRGLTLIELAIALPSYREYVLRSHLGEAMSNLTAMRTQAERHFQDRRTYVGMPCTPAHATPHFSFSCGSPSATGYTITATGAGSMSGFSYSIDQADLRRTVALPAGWTGAGETSTCWVTRRSGTC